VEKATVHLFPPTTCSRRVLMCLAELGCEEGREFVINLVSTAGPNKTAAHMRLQPFGKIPAWQEGDWVLFESLAICEYLCVRFPGAVASRLLPPPGRARAEVHKWVSIEATELRPHALKIYIERVVKPMKRLGAPDEGIVEEGRRGATPTLDVLDAHLAVSGHDYLVGVNFTLADLGFVPYLQALCDAGCEDLLEARPSLHAWFVRCRARPTWQAVVAMSAR